MNGYMYFKDRTSYTKALRKAYAEWLPTLTKRQKKRLDNPNDVEKPKEQQRAETRKLRKKAKLCKRLSKHSKNKIWTI